MGNATVDVWLAATTGLKPETLKLKTHRNGLADSVPEIFPSPYLNQPGGVLGDLAMKSFSELTGKEKSSERLRWICVPAAAVLGVFVLRIIAGFVMMPALALLSGSAAMPASDFRRFFLSCVSGILTAAVFVIAGAKTAPRGRLATAIVLAGLWSLSALGSHALVHLSQGTPHYTHFVVEAVGAAGAAVAIGYSEKSNGRRR